MSTTIEQPAYIAGPMRGYPRFNFDTFNKAGRLLDTLGYKTVFNPAAADLAAGFNPETSIPVTKAAMAEFMKRDCDFIVNKAEVMFMLPGWERSVGASAEHAMAKWKMITIRYFNADITDAGDKPIPSEDILEEALRITRGDRQNQYGPPDQDFQRTADMWTALKGVPFTKKEVALFMVLLKCSRQTHQDKRDNWVDIAGYARCGSICS